MYYTNVTGDLEEATQVYELWSKSYPNAAVPVNNLGDLAGSSAPYDKAVARAQDGLRIDPNVVVACTNLASDFLAFNPPTRPRRFFSRRRSTNSMATTSAWSRPLVRHERPVGRGERQIPQPFFDHLEDGSDNRRTHRPAGRRRAWGRGARSPPTAPSHRSTRACLPAHRCSARPCDGLHGARRRTARAPDRPCYAEQPSATPRYRTRDRIASSPR